MKRKDTKGNRTATLDVRVMALADLQEHPRNAEIRKHPAPGTAKWETLKKSLKHDYFDPIVLNLRNGQLVSGHLRRRVMMEDDMYTHASVVCVDYDEPTHMARMLAANKSVGDNDLEGLKQWFSEFSTIDDFNFDITGFDMGEIDGMGNFDPAFDFDDEDDTTGEPPPEAGEADYRGIRYLQLIYSPEEYEEIQTLIAAYKKAKNKELTATFGDDCNDFANIVLHLFRHAS